MDSEGSFVNEEIEAIIEFYEALPVESTPSRESKICESVFKGLTMLFAFPVLTYWFLWVVEQLVRIRCDGRDVVYIEAITCPRRIIRDEKK